MYHGMLMLIILINVHASDIIIHISDVVNVKGAQKLFLCPFLPKVVRKIMKPFCLLLSLITPVCAGTMQDLPVELSLEIARNFNPFDLNKLILDEQSLATFQPYYNIFKDISQRCKIYDQIENDVLWIDSLAFTADCKINYY